MFTTVAIVLVHNRSFRKEGVAENVRTNHQEYENKEHDEDDINLLWQLSTTLSGRETRAVESLRDSLARSLLHKATEATGEKRWYSVHLAKVS